MKGLFILCILLIFSIALIPYSRCRIEEFDNKLRNVTSNTGYLNNLRVNSNVVINNDTYLSKDGLQSRNEYTIESEDNLHLIAAKDVNVSNKAKFNKDGLHVHNGSIKVSSDEPGSGDIRMNGNSIKFSNNDSGSNGGLELTDKSINLSNEDPRKGRVRITDKSFKISNTKLESDSGLELTDKSINLSNEKPTDGGLKITDKSIKIISSKPLNDDDPEITETTPDDPSNENEQPRDTGLELTDKYIKLSSATTDDGGIEISDKSIISNSIEPGILLEKKSGSNRYGLGDFEDDTMRLYSTTSQMKFGFANGDDFNDAMTIDNENNVYMKSLKLGDEAGISNDTSSMMITGMSSDGENRVSIKDRLDIERKLCIGDLCVTKEDLQELQDLKYKN